VGVSAHRQGGEEEDAGVSSIGLSMNDGNQNQRDWYPGNVAKARTTIGYCSHIFRPEFVSDERPDESVICCVFLAVDRSRANT
jgi:hypothetical protein